MGCAASRERTHVVQPEVLPPPTEAPVAPSVSPRSELATEAAAPSVSAAEPAHMSASRSFRDHKVPQLLLSRLSENHSVAYFSAADCATTEPATPPLPVPAAEVVEEVVAAPGAADQPFVGLDDAQPSSARTEASSVDAVSHSSFNALRVNQYVLGPTLGVGSFGKVRRCMDTTTGEELAVKILRKSLLKRKRIGRFGNALQNVEREVAIWKKLDHPHVVRLIEALDDDADHLYLVSELVAGGPCMSGNEPLPLKQIQVIAAQLLDAMRYLHFQRVVHRDIKPDNLLVTSRAGLTTARRQKAAAANLSVCGSDGGASARADTQFSAGGESMQSRTTLVSSAPAVSVPGDGNSSVGGSVQPSTATGSMGARSASWTRPAVLAVQPVHTRSRTGSFVRLDEEGCGVMEMPSVRLDCDALSRAPSRLSIVIGGEDGAGTALDPEDESVYPADADIDLFSPTPAHFKPGLLAPFDLVLKVTDFGVSQVAAAGEGGDRTRSTAGTPAFLSPEMVAVPAGPATPSLPPWIAPPKPSDASATGNNDGMHSGFAADVWAAGMTLYTLLHGAPAFSEPTLPLLFEAIRSKPIPWPRDEEEELGQDPDYQGLKDLICRMLDRNPDTRVTVDEALAHPWVAAIAQVAHQESDGITPAASDASTPATPQTAAATSAASSEAADIEGRAPATTPSAGQAGDAAVSPAPVLRPAPTIRIHVSDEEVAQAISPVTSFRALAKSASFAKKWAAKVRSFHNKDKESNSSNHSISTSVSSV